MGADLVVKPMRTLKRLAISIPLILVGVFIFTHTTAYYLFKPCVENFSSQLPVYPDAEITEDNRQWQQNFGIGTPHLELRTPANSTVVQRWYMREISGMIYNAQRDETAPVEWQGIYQVIPLAEGGSRVVLRMFCDRRRF